MFLSSFINSKRSAMIIGYMIALVGSVIGIVICSGIYGRFEFSLPGPIPWYLMIWPQFSFIRG